MEKTAMTELIKYLNKDFDWFVKNSPEHGVIPQIIKKATELLEKEKQQLIDFYDRGHDTNFELAEDYYNNKYTQ